MNRAAEGFGVKAKRVFQCAKTKKVDYRPKVQRKNNEFGEEEEESIITN